MGKGPDLHAREHRVLEHALDPPRQIGRDESHESDPDERKREVTRPHGRIPDRDRAARTVLPVADDDQDEAGEREKRVDPLVGPLPDRLMSAARLPRAVVDR